MCRLELARQKLMAAVEGDRPAAPVALFRDITHPAVLLLERPPRVLGDRRAPATQASVAHALDLEHRERKRPTDGRLVLIGQLGVDPAVVVGLQKVAPPLDEPRAERFVAAGVRLEGIRAPGMRPQPLHGRVIDRDGPALAAFATAAAGETRSGRKDEGASHSRGIHRLSDVAVPPITLTRTEDVPQRPDASVTVTRTSYAPGT